MVSRCAALQGALQAIEQQKEKYLKINDMKTRIIDKRQNVLKEMEEIIPIKEGDRVFINGQEWGVFTKIWNLEKGLLVVTLYDLNF